MKTPIYTRRWFKVGGLLVLLGLFCYGLALHQTAEYEALYPDLGKDQNQLLLENLARSAPDGTEPALSEAELNERTRITHLHGIYRIYIVVGWIFMILGALLMAVSVKEPQVPTLEDLDDDPTPS